MGVIAAWLALPVLAAIALLVAVSGRVRMAAGLILPIGPLVLAVVVLGVVAGLSPAWGMWPAMASAAVSMACAIIVLVKLSRMGTVARG